MKLWYLVSSETLVVGQVFPPSILGTVDVVHGMVAARARAARLPMRHVSIGRVRMIVETEELRVKSVRIHHNRPEPQLTLFPVVCAGCQASFYPMARWRATYCADCRPKQRERYWQKRAKRAQQPRPTTAATPCSASTSPADTPGPCTPAPVGALWASGPR